MAAGLGVTCISRISATRLPTMALTGILQLILVVSALAERCTKAVPVQKYPPKKMNVMRRLPAKCSNWDRAWSWLTRKDCGTKYRLEVVTVPSREVQYKIKHVCCDNDPDCENGGNLSSGGFDSTDERFLAIVLGSAAAAVIIIIVIIAISLCTRKRRCLSNRGNGHDYDRAENEDRDGVIVVQEKFFPEDKLSDEDGKGPEPVYAEIGDSTLPRYTDLFKSPEAGQEDPFKHATAPPPHAPANARTMASKQQSAQTLLKSAAAYPNPATVNGASNQKNMAAVASSRDDDKYPSVQAKSNRTLQEFAPNGEITETRYYNVREKKKKKKRRTKSANDKDAEVTSDSGASVAVRKPKGNPPGTVEMMVKSSSASGPMASSGRPNRETSLSQQKRRSAPPDSPELRVVTGNGARRAQTGVNRTPCQSVVSVPSDNRTNDTIPICTVHQKPDLSPISTSTHVKMSDIEGRKTTSVLKNQRRGKGEGGGVGETGGVSKSGNKNSVTFKSPPVLKKSESLQRERQSYENIPETILINSNESRNVKSSKKKVKSKGDHPEVHSMHLKNKPQDVQIDESTVIHVPPPRQFSNDNEEGELPITNEEADSVSPLLCRRVEDSIKRSSQNKVEMEQSCAYPLLNDQQSYLPSIPSSHSGFSADSAWSGSSGRDAGDYDTLEYSYDPSLDDEHIYQKLEMDGVDPHGLPKC